MLRLFPFLVCDLGENGPSKLNQLFSLGRVTVYDPPRETEKTKSISINWTAGDEKAEVCDGSQGLCVERYSEAIGSQTSHLCKKNLYGLFNEASHFYDVYLLCYDDS